jgi:hypothetical protein
VRLSGEAEVGSSCTDLEEDELEKKERLADEIIKELCIHTSVEAHPL